MQSHSFLPENHRTGAGSFHQYRYHKQQRRDENQSEKRTCNIHAALCYCAHGVGQRNITDINNRKPHQILHIWSSGNQTVVVRNKFGMHTGLLTQIHQLLQAAVVLKGKRDRDLVQLVFRQDVQKVVDGTQNLHSLIGCSSRNLIIQNSSYHISPLGIAVDPVNIFLRCAGIPHQKDIFAVVAFFSYKMQAVTDKCPHQKSAYRVDGRKQRHHTA